MSWYGVRVTSGLPLTRDSTLCGARIRDRSGAEQRRRQRLARSARRDQARHLFVGEEVVFDERGGQRALDRGELRRLRLRALLRDLAEDAEGLLRRGVL